jgi:sec-independent protein translocase protein TatC
LPVLIARIANIARMNSNLPEIAPSREPLNAENAPEESLMSHLIELRRRLMYACLAVLILFAGLLVFPGQKAIYNALFEPMVNALSSGAGGVTNPVDSFVIPIKLVLLVAFFGALPWVLYQVYAFVAPGLYTQEKRLVLPVIVSSTALFFCGVAFCHFLVFAKVFTFFREIAPESVTYTPDIAKVFSFVTTMFLAFGVTFEIPVVVVILVRLGMVSLDKLREIRGYVIVAAFVISAVVTPPDALSQLMLAIPMIALYELGLLVARLTGTRTDELRTEEQTN